MASSSPAVFSITGADKAASPELTLEDRRALAGVLLGNATMADEIMTLLTATETVAASLARAIDSGDPKLLLLPRMGVTGSRECAA